MRDGFDIRVFGDKELERAFGKLTRRLQRKYIVRVFKQHLEVVRSRIIGFLSGHPIEVRTGRLLSAMTNARKRPSTRRPRALVRWGIEWPTRQELGIDAEDPHFFPSALEYGTSTMRARPFMRPAIDNFRKLDIARIARRLRAELRKEGAS